MADDKKKETKKERKPTALKRDIQGEKKRLHNKQFKSSVRTAIRVLETAIQKKENADEKLSAVFSLMDKGVKTGVFKQNKANRTKAKLTKAAV
jgi:small subunit ribosomal protein S20